MANNTKIEWTATHNADGTVTPGKTWNPQHGCTAVSAGCANCYAIRESHVHAGNTGKAGKRFQGLTTVQGNGRIGWSGAINFHEDRLIEPLSWQKPCKVFVNSMSDTFHEDVPVEWQDKLFAVMALCPHITFQVLTKRPHLMRTYFSDVRVWSRIAEARIAILENHTSLEIGGKRYRQLLDNSRFSDRLVKNLFPLPNVWLGTSVENQETADLRIPELINTPAVVRFLSCEPLLGPVDLMRWLDIASSYTCRFDPTTCTNIQTSPTTWHKVEHPLYEQLDIPEPPIPIHWVIVGGESGNQARPIYPEWVQSLRDQCTAASVPFFWKQWGEWLPYSQGMESYPYMINNMKVRIRRDMPGYGYEEFWRVGKKDAGRLLNGKEYSEFPRTNVVVSGGQTDAA